jgi:hypothetical protein
VKIKLFFQECENRRIQEDTSQHASMGTVVSAGRERLFAVSDTAANSHRCASFRVGCAESSSEIFTPNSRSNCARYTPARMASRSWALSQGFSKY